MAAFWLIVGEDLGEILPEWLVFRPEAGASHLHDHQKSGDEIVGVDEEQAEAEMFARLLAQPANDLHPAIGTVDRHKLVPPEVVIEMDFVPGLFEPGKAVGDVFHPDRMRVLGQKDLGTARVIIEKQQAALFRLGFSRRSSVRPGAQTSR